VITPGGESLIQKSIRELASSLDPYCFCQIHRNTIVNLSQIAKVSGSLTGRGVIRLKHRSETLGVSRAYLHFFKRMVVAENKGSRGWVKIAPWNGQLY